MRKITQIKIGFAAGILVMLANGVVPYQTRMLGENLIDLTLERELLLDASSYDARSTHSARLPGALLRALKFTL